MADPLSVAIGTVLSVLEMVETKHGVVSDVKLVEIGTTPTNVIEFSMAGRRYEVLVNERPSPLPSHQAPSTSTVKLTARKAPAKRKQKQLTLSL